MQKYLKEEELEPELLALNASKQVSATSSSQVVQNNNSLQSIDITVENHNKLIVPLVPQEQTEPDYQAINTELDQVSHSSPLEIMLTEDFTL